MTTGIKGTLEKIKKPMIVISLLAAFLLSLYIRAVLPHDSVFLANGVISISEDDGVYQMRIVEWIIHNYPNFLSFDPYTFYPHGNPQFWAPLFTFSLATIIWIVGLGSPSLETTYTIGAYFPAVLGALVIFPTYYIAKNVFDDRRVGILSAFIIALLPGQFLSRSLLGFTDHHIAETLLSTVTILFLVLSVKAARKNNFTFSDIKSLKWSALKPSIYYFILTGVFLALFILTWNGALLFAFIIGIYIVVQHVVDHMHNKKTEYLAVLGFIIFLICLITIILVPDYGDQKPLYYVGLTIGLIFFPLLSGLSIFLNNKGYEKYYYPLSLAALIIVGLVFISAAMPSVFDTLKNSLNFFARSGGGLTIGEASPYFDRNGSFSLEPLNRDFGINGIIAFLGLAVLAYGAMKKQRQEKTVLTIWTIMMVWALFQQNRFAYYFAVNVAILSAYFGISVADRILEFGGWNESIGKKSTMRADLNKNKDIKKASKNQSSGSQVFDLKKIKVSHILSILVALFFVAYLVYPLIEPATNMGKYGRDFRPYVYESLTWMRYNTPEPGIDYYGKYQEPPPGKNYLFPESAYGVMSWWDYGHVITAWAHRIPNANPFQRGIGGGSTHAPGASTFLAAQSEEEANAVLGALGINGKPGARYVMTDDYINFAAFGAVLAWAEIPYDGYYTQVQTNKGPQVVPYTKRYNAMMMRLHLFDGDGLKTYRLVHESVPAANADGNVGYGEAGFKDVYNKLYKGNLPVAYTGAVKIFEHVKGARITGKAPANTTVSVSLNVRTNQNRDYSYSQKTISNGTYELIVPYSTEGPISGETQFDTKPTGKYTITAGNSSKQLVVNEKDVLEGEIINLDLV